jgi:hypothetical protein
VVSALAGQVRVLLLRDQAQRRSARCARLGEYIQRLTENGWEPSAQLCAEFDKAYRLAVSAELEYRLALGTTEETVTSDGG